MNDQGLTDEEFADPMGLPMNPATKVVLDLPDNGRGDQGRTHGSGYLTISVRDDEDPVVYMENALDAVYRTKAFTFMSLKERERRQVLKRALNRFWEKRTEAKRPRPHSRNEREYCFDLIWKVIFRIDKSYDPWSPDLPLWKGKHITAYRLAKLMGLIDDQLSGETHRKYAKLWVRYRQLFKTSPLLKQ